MVESKDFKEYQANILFKAFDKDDNGSISLKEVRPVPTSEFNALLPLPHNFVACRAVHLGLPHCQ